MHDWDSEEVRTHEVRLFPTIRIASEREAELRATASLCAMIRAVSEFGRSVVKMADGPAGRLSCYSEVPFKVDEPDGGELRPDALIRVVRGKTEWKAMVEVKVGDNPLRDDQVTAYHKLVRQEQFNALITISNQTALPDGLPPVNLDKRRLRASPVVHLSWDRLLSEAQMLASKKGIEDADQQWMIEEWVKYVADPRSRIITPPDLGEKWAAVLQSARENNLVAKSRELLTTVERWDSFLRKVSLRLRAKLGVDVERRVSKSDKQDPPSRTRRLHTDALKTGCLEGALKIPDAVGDVHLNLNLQARAVRFSVELRAPNEGRNQTRINWLVRRLKGADTPQDLIVKVAWSQRQLESQGRTDKVLADSTRLLRNHNGQPIGNDVTPKRFILEWTTGLKKGRGKNTAPVLDKVASDLERFYRGVVEQLAPFVPKAPRLPKAVESKEPAVAPDDGQAAETSGSGPADSRKSNEA